MSEADKIIKNLKNSGKKVEEFYVSNKTSDKNVALIEELIQEYKTYNDLDGIQDLSMYINAMRHILLEREQKDKQIQELEEEKAMLKRASNIAKEVNIEDVTDVINKSCKEFMSNYIPKQAVIDKIKELDIAILECEYDDDDVEEYKNDVEKEKRILLIKKSALEELLEEK